MSDTPARLDDLRRQLAALGRDGAPQVARLAEWAMNHPEEMAFHSVRGLAERAGVNANTVFRLSRSMGFSGFEACRGAFQEAMRKTAAPYSARATRLAGASSGVLVDQLRAATHANIDALFTPEGQERIEEAAKRMLGARRIFCIGVRSCFSLAHYLSYSGRMAFSSFSPRISEPGDIFDAISEAGPEDVVIPITFSLYSIETVRAHRLALARKAQIISITDSYASPIAEGADVVFLPEMDGPQTLPSLGAAFILAETLVAAMVAASEDAVDRIRRFEDRLMASGTYQA